MTPQIIQKLENICLFVLLKIIFIFLFNKQKWMKLTYQKDISNYICHKFILDHFGKDIPHFIRKRLFFLFIVNESFLIYSK